MKLFTFARCIDNLGIKFHFCVAIGIAVNVVQKENNRQSLCVFIRFIKIIAEAQKDGIEWNIRQLSGNMTTLWSFPY